MIAMNPERVMAQADTMKSTVSKMDTLVDSLNTTCKELSSVWKDENQANFDVALKNFIKDYNELSPALKTFLDKAKAHAEKMKRLGKS